MKTLKGALVRLGISIATALFLAGCAVPLADEANYVSTVLSQVQRASTNITTLSALASNPQVNDPAWREQVSKQLVELRDIAIAARALTPPASLADAHQSYMSTISQLEQIAISVEQGIATGDPARMREAMSLLAEAERLLMTVQGLIGG